MRREKDLLRVGISPRRKQEIETFEAIGGWFRSTEWKQRWQAGHKLPICVRK
jgi:hypothetical protein